MTEDHIVIATADGPMPAYEAVPNGEARGAVLVIQEAFGITTHIEDIARRLANAGWYAVAPAFFHRQDPSIFAYDDFDSVMPAIGKLTARDIEIDVRASLDHFAHNGFATSAVGVVGFCMGGSLSFWAASQYQLGAAVTFYGGGVAEGRFGLPSLLDLSSSLQTPWLGFYGDLDKGISTEEVESLRSAVDTTPVATEIVRYSDADHGFNCDDRPSVFNATAAEDAWDRTLKWFDAHLRG